MNIEEKVNALINCILAETEEEKESAISVAGTTCTLGD